MPRFNEESLAEFQEVVNEYLEDDQFARCVCVCFWLSSRRWSMSTLRMISLPGVCVCVSG